MVWIRAEWCGSVRTGVESVLVRAESAESVLVCAESVLVRAESAESVLVHTEHQGEGKLLKNGKLTGDERDRHMH